MREDGVSASESLDVLPSLFGTIKAVDGADTASRICKGFSESVNAREIDLKARRYNEKVVVQSPAALRGNEIILWMEACDRFGIVLDARWNDTLHRSNHAIVGLQACPNQGPSRLTTTKKTINHTRLRRASEALMRVTRLSVPGSGVH